MNAMLNSDRVIVTNIAGTTRDVIEEKIEIDGYLLRIFDTAGIRETENVIEKEGIKRSQEIIKSADILLHIIDSADFSNDDIMEYSEYENKLINVFNKIDKSKLSDITTISEQKHIKISCKNEIGISELKKAIVKKAMKNNISYESASLTNLRHYNILIDVLENLKFAQTSLLNGFNNEVIIPDIRTALDSLGELTGETTSMDILNNIFGNFCVGK